MGYIDDHFQILAELEACVLQIVVICFCKGDKDYQ